MMRRRNVLSITLALSPDFDQQVEGGSAFPSQQILCSAVAHPENLSDWCDCATCVGVGRGGVDLPQGGSHLKDDPCIARLARLPDLLVVFLEVPLGRFDGDNPEADDAKDDVLVLSQH